MVRPTLVVGMATEPVPMGIHPNFDGKNLNWLGLGFPRFKKTGAGNVDTNAYPKPAPLVSKLHFYLY